MVDKLKELISKTLGSRKWVVGIAGIVVYILFFKDTPTGDKILLFLGSLIGVEGLADIAKRLGKS